MKKGVATRVVVGSILAVCLLLEFFLLPATTQAATRPGYNGKIVYESWVGSGEIYTMNADGSDKIRLTNNSASDSYPEWSPDGTKIAFASRRDANNQEIYVMNADGSNQTRLTNAAGIDWLPHWSPDGSKIMFESNRTGNDEIFVMNADGSNQTNISNHSGADRRPDWSPDGTKVAFSSNRDGTLKVYVINSDGTGLSVLTPSYGFYLRWSPDGSKIAYGCAPVSSDDVCVMNADGTNHMTIINTPTLNEFNQSIRWSPDGTKIAAISDDDTNFDLTIAQADGSGSQIVHVGNPQRGLVDGIQWAPDGSNLLVTLYSDVDWTDYDYVLVNEDGTGETYLTSDHASGYGDWHTISNTLPDTNNDFSSVSFNTSTLVDVLPNDTDEEALSGSNLTVSVQPAHGTAVIEAGKIKYTPSNGYQGPDSLTYQICDSFMLDQKCATGILNLTVLAPTAPNIAVTNVNGETYNQSTNHYETSNLRPTFSGTATPGAEITVEIHSDPTILTTTADSNGNWSVTPTFDLPSGQHMVYISATLYGLSTELDSFQLLINDELAATGVSMWSLLAVGTALWTGGLGLFEWKRRSSVLAKEFR